MQPEQQPERENDLPSPPVPGSSVGATKRTAMWASRRFAHLPTDDISEAPTCPDEYDRLGDSQDAHGPRAAVDVEDGPQRQRDVDVHQQRRRLAVARHRHLAVVRQMELDLVAQLGSVGHVLGDDPVLGPINQHVGVVWQVRRRQRRRIARGETEAHAAHVDALRLNDLFIQQKKDNATLIFRLEERK